MNLRTILSTAIAAAIFSATAAHAGTITFGGVASTPLTPSADSYALAMSAATFTTPGAVSQTGTFTTGDSGQLAGTIPFSFTESITVNGVTQLITFTGNVNVDPSQDTFTIDAHGPIYIGGDTLTFSGASTVNNFVGDSNFTLDGTAIAGTPEPSSLMLLGTGVFGAAGMARRRFLKS